MSDELVKMEFRINTSYKGAEYGPDYKKTAEVHPKWAGIFERQGRAVPVEPKESTKPDEEPKGLTTEKSSTVKKKKSK